MSATTKTRANWRTPTAVRVDVNETTDRAAWLLERRNGLGGTDAAALLGVHTSLSMSSAKDVTPAHVFLDKTSDEPPVEDDKDIFAFGHALEAELMRRAEERFGISVRRGGLFRHKAEPWRYANPDGLASDGGIAEGKTASNRSKAAELWLAGDVTEHAYVQTQHYLAVTGRSHSYYTVGIRDDFTNWQSVPRKHWGEKWFADMAIKEFVQVGPVERNDEVIAHLLDVEREWWGYIQARELPEALMATVPAAERYTVGVKDQDVAALVPAMTTDDLLRRAALKRQVDAAGKELKAIEGRFKDAIGGAEYLTVNGTRAIRWSSFFVDKFDQKTFAADHPDLAAKYTTRRPQRRLTILEQKA